MENADIKTMEASEVVEKPKAKAKKVKKEVKEKVKEEKDLTSQEKLDQLKEFRTNGSISLDVTYKDFKFIRNAFRSKTSWEGPNEAYLLCVLSMDIERILSTMDEKSTEAQKVNLLNSSIEAMSIFINKISGSNLTSAQNNLSMLMTLNQAISQLQSIDKQMNKLNTEILEGEIPDNIKKVKK